MNQHIFDIVVQFFKEDSWNFQQIKDKSVLKMSVNGANGQFQCFAIIDEESERFVFYSTIETKVPKDKRLMMSEFLTRANYGLNIGNFEMDFSDGELRYKTSINVEGGQLTTTMVKNLVYVNVLTLDKYFPSIMKVIYADMSPDEAIALIEG